MKRGEYNRHMWDDEEIPERTRRRMRAEAQREVQLRAAAAEAGSSGDEQVEVQPAAALHEYNANHVNSEPEPESGDEPESGEDAESDAWERGGSGSEAASGHDFWTDSDNDVEMNAPSPEPQDEVNGRGQSPPPSPPPPPPPPNGENALGNDGPNRRVFLGDRLCGCTDTTEGDAFLMCLALGSRNHFSYVAMVQTLQMVNRLYGREVLHATKYFLLKHFDVGKNSTTVHIYCSECENYLGSREHVAEQEVVQCNSCGAAVKAYSKSSSYFVAVDLEQQLKDLMHDPAVAEEIMNYRFNRRKLNANAREDIFDGDMYKNLLQQGQPLSNPLNFSFTMNTDGMATGDSSAQSAWPIFLNVNELAPENRRKHMLYAGMWVGQKQPNMRLFLDKFVENLRSLINTGFNWTDVHGNIQVSKVFPLVAVLDSAARYKFLNLTCYSGYFGCTFCYQRSVNTPRGRRFVVADRVAPLRTQDSMIQDMRIAHANRNHEIRRLRVHQGCKGFTPLVMLAPYFDLGRGVVVDYMHNGLTGVTRNHVMSMLSSANTDFYIGSPENKFIMDQRLTKIRPPSSITRTPRTIEQAKLYKASEWRSFLLFYGLILFSGVLDNKYLEHFAMLSCAFYLLLERSVQDDDLEQANIYLRQYVFLTEQYFGMTAMTFNIHLLLHVAQSVLDWGPIWAFATFMFEGENRVLANMITSPGRMAIALTRRYLMFKALPKLCETYASSEEPLDFIQDISGKSYKTFIRCNNAVLVGSGTNYYLSEEEQDCFTRHNIVYDVNVLAFQQMLFNKIKYTTRDYCEGMLFDDSWIKDQEGRRGYIKRIFCVNDKVVILVQTVKIDRALFFATDRVKVKHIKKIEREDVLVALEPQEIIGQCIFAESRDRLVMDIPYGCYGD